MLLNWLKPSSCIGRTGQLSQLHSFSLMSGPLGRNYLILIYYFYYYLQPKVIKTRNYCALLTSSTMRLRTLIMDFSWWVFLNSQWLVIVTFSAEFSWQSLLAPWVFFTEFCTVIAWRRDSISALTTVVSWRHETNLAPIIPKILGTPSNPY